LHFTFLLLRRLVERTRFDRLVHGGFTRSRLIR